jgi:hypothetical protein
MIQLREHHDWKKNLADGFNVFQELFMIGYQFRINCCKETIEL